MSVSLLSYLAHSASLLDLIPSRSLSHLAKLIDYVPSEIGDASKAVFQCLGCTVSTSVVLLYAAHSLRALLKEGLFVHGLWGMGHQRLSIPYPASCSSHITYMCSCAHHISHVLIMHHVSHIQHHAHHTSCNTLVQMYSETPGLLMPMRLLNCRF